MKINRFEDLQIWKDSLILTKVIYDMTSRKPLSNDFVLRDQIRKSVISISSNVVEGFEKFNNNEFVRFLRIAKGSAGELKNQVYISNTVGYISDREQEEIVKKLDIISGQIGKLMSYLLAKKRDGDFTFKTR